MRKNNLKKLSISVLMMALVAAMAVIGTACAKKQAATEVASEVVAEVVSEVASEVATSETEDGVTVIGEGETDFSLEVVYADGKADYFTVKTDAADLGTALTEAGIVEGEDSDYGLYIKTVNGVTADYDADQSWWGFYINDEMASVGVSDTTVEEGAKYSLKYEK
jgi:hypothetical protein